MYQDELLKMSADQPVWPPNTRLHDDSTFGRLTLDSCERGRFLLRYEGWEVRLDTRAATIETVCPGDLPKTYILERIAVPLLRLLCGCLLFHASASSDGRGADGYLAPSGIGKSTLIAGVMAFTDRLLVSDDIMTLNFDAENNATAIPLSSQIAMRHDMFDHAECVESVEWMGYKRLLTLRPCKVQPAPVPLKRIVLLSDGDLPLRRIPFSGALATLLRQQMALSNPPKAFVRKQFHDIMRLKNVPCFELGISCADIGHVRNAVSKIDNDSAGVPPRTLPKA